MFLHIASMMYLSYKCSVCCCIFFMAAHDDRAKIGKGERVVPLAFLSLFF